MGAHNITTCSNCIQSSMLLSLSDLMWTGRLIAGMTSSGGQVPCAVTTGSSGAGAASCFKQQRYSYYLLLLLASLQVSALLMPFRFHLVAAIQSPEGKAKGLHKPRTSLTCLAETLPVPAGWPHKPTRAHCICAGLSYISPLAGTPAHLQPLAHSAVKLLLRCVIRSAPTHVGMPSHFGVSPQNGRLSAMHTQSTQMRVGAQPCKISTCSARGAVHGPWAQQAGGCVWCSVNAELHVWLLPLNTIIPLSLY
jgi:hypothetical protein